MKNFINFKRPINILSFGVIIGIFLGLVIGLSVNLYIQNEIFEILLIFIGAVFGILLEIFYKYITEYLESIKRLEPLKKVLGTISFDNSFIYISPFKRIIEESPLYRIDPDRQDLAVISGTPYVYGKGDAIALALVLRAIDNAVSKKYEPQIQEGEEVIDIWGRSVICIGAHNRKTREILGKFKRTGFRFVSNYTIISSEDCEPIQNLEGKSFIKGIRIKSMEDSSAIDYGVILKLKDQFHRPFDKTIIVIAGLGDIGTAGAAYFLLHHYTQLPLDKDEFAVLIQVPSGYQSARMVDFDSFAKYCVVV